MNNNFRKYIIIFSSVLFSIQSKGQFYAVWKYSDLELLSDSNQISFKGTYYHSLDELNVSILPVINSDGYWLIGLFEDSLQLRITTSEINKIFINRNKNVKSALVNYLFKENFGQLTWSNFQILKIGKWLEIYKKGTVCFTQLEIQKNAELQGKILFYKSNKILTNISSYEEGKLNGPFTSFYDDGNLLSIGNHKNDSPSEFVVFYKNQRVKWQLSTLNKYEKEWASNGKLIRYTQVDSESKNNGVSKGWYQNGKIKFSGNYLHGKAIGKWVFYDKKGKVTYTTY